MPASSDILTDIVPAETRSAANALLRFGQTAVKVGGPAAGAALVAVVGPPWGIAWDALSFAGSAVLLSRLTVRGATVTRQPEFRHQLRDGWAGFRSRRRLAIMTRQAALAVPVRMAGHQLLGPLYGQRVLGGASAWGTVMSAFAAGLVSGADAALWWRPRGVGIVGCAGTGAMAAPPATMALHTGATGLVVTTASTGAAVSLSMTGWLQEVIPLDRVTADTAFGQSVTLPLDYLAASPAAHVLGLGAALIAVLVVLLPEVRLLGRPVIVSGRGGAGRRPPRRPRAATAVRGSDAWRRSRSRSART